MTSRIVINSPGLCTTVQDVGRISHQNLGVPPSGAMDRLAMAAANALVGNDPRAAVLEFCYTGPGFEVEDGPVRVAVVGGDAALRLADGTLIPGNRSAVLAAGEKVTVLAPQSATYGVLAVSGGIEVAEVLASRSTFLRGAFGGLDGRPLAAGDAFEVASADTGLPDLELAAELPYGQGPIRVVLGPQADYFDDENIERFLSEQYRITRDSDRMGMRLAGEPLRHARGYDIATDGVVNGSVQVPGNGMPVILLSDRQTVGGYPKIATVISSDLPRLGMLKPGEAISFEAVGIEEAVAIRRAQVRRLEELCQSLRPVRRAGAIDVSTLLGENLISGVAIWDEP